MLVVGLSYNNNYLLFKICCKIVVDVILFPYGPPAKVSNLGKLHLTWFKS